MITDLNLHVQWTALPPDALMHMARLAPAIQDWIGRVVPLENTETEQHIAQAIAVGEQLFSGLYNWVRRRVATFRETHLLCILQRYTEAVLVNF